MKAKRILLIEDTQEIGCWVQEELKKRGYDVCWLLSGEHADKEIGGVDVVILDIMLPGLDGFTVGQRLKKAAPTVPIMLLSARAAVEDKLQGLQFADDYVTKPFYIDEIAARIEVLLRRSGAGLADHIKLGQYIQVNLPGRTVVNERTGEEVTLTGKEYQILECFLRHPNQILTQEQIWTAVWGDLYINGDKALSVHIRHLREKLEQDPNAPEIIQTVRGIGYRMKL
ncbi:response regulator transcription factor [Paenibacillus xylaniclasticus]|uniref:response regulator transcription factor n=1 Tax=Paenibacillus xylaniclasticus TaxID=588083 RepID=UPI000FDB2095|nr:MULTISPECIES: response regulator transcription factor [Paenibacillus]GFN33176.1 putative transcriptional regulatory protein YkoG [Paenibacillus curdlanolyticus]